MDSKFIRRGDVGSLLNAILDVCGQCVSSGELSNCIRRKGRRKGNEHAKETGELIQGMAMDRKSKRQNNSSRWNEGS